MIVLKKNFFKVTFITLILSNVTWWQILSYSIYVFGNICVSK